MAATKGFARSASSGVQAAVKALPSPKRVDTSQFSGLVQRVAEAKRGAGQFAATRGTNPPITAGSPIQGRADWVTEGKPIDVKRLGTITTPYGGSTQYEKFHPGVDVAAPIGTRQPAFVGGRVAEVVGGKRQGQKGYGNYVVVEDHQGNRWRYSHLNRSWLQVGQQIQPGQFIGEIGNTGSTYSTSGGTGAHLDLRITDAFNRYVNPAKFGIRY